MNTSLHFSDPIEEPMPIYPIPGEWIIEGEPDSRGRILLESADGQLSCGQWRCTPSKFRWEYRFDEFIWLKEGEVTISIEGGTTMSLRAGDTAHFSSGTVAVWHIIRPVHKVFFCRNC